MGNEPRVVFSEQGGRVAGGVGDVIGHGVGSGGIGVEGGGVDGDGGKGQIAGVGGGGAGVGIGAEALDGEGVVANKGDGGR